MSRGGSRPTLADVAARAGVSRTTASNAYNRPDQLSPAQRVKILAAADELGYAGPDPLARSLRTRTAGALGLIFSAQLSTAFSDPAAVEFLHGVAQACEERGHSLLLVPAGPDAENTATVARAAVDGFVIYSMPEGDPHVQAALARPESAIVVDSPTGVAGAGFVGIDDRQAFGLVAEHVLTLGHRRLAFVGLGAAVPWNADWTDWRHPPAPAHAVPRERLRGLTDAIARLERGSEDVSVRTLTGRVNSHEAGRAVADELVGTDGAPTAILCTSDVVALGIMARLQERGIAIPGQVTVTGFDDVPVAAASGLTTVAQPMYDKGYLAAGWLLDEVAGRPDAVEQNGALNRILPTRLVVRGSSGSVPTG